MQHTRRALSAFAATLVLTTVFAQVALAQTGAAPAAPNVSAPVVPAAPAAPAVASPAAPAATDATAPVAPNAAPPPGEHAVTTADLPQDLSPWGMFQDADLLVKIVLIGLAFASLVTWTVWLAKTIELRSARREVREDLRILNSSATLAQAHEQLRDGTSPVSLLMQAAGQEIRRLEGTHRLAA